MAVISTIVDVSAGQISNGDDIGQGPDATTATFTQTDAAGGRLQLAQANHVIDLHLTGTYTTANFAFAERWCAWHDGYFCPKCLAGGPRVGDIHQIEPRPLVRSPVRVPAYSAAA